MNESIEFKTAKELYDRVLPALYSKVRELKSSGFKFVTEKDIWNYLVSNDWKTRKDLQLCDLINDILYADNYRINDFVMSKLEILKKDTDSDINDFEDDVL